MLKKITLMLLSVLVIASLTACSTKEEQSANPTANTEVEVVASVNGTEIKWDKYRNMVEDMKQYYQQFGMDFDSVDNKELLSMLEEEALSILIQEELLYQHALDNNYKVTEEELDREIELFKSQFDNEDEFLEVLSLNRLNLDEFRIKIGREKLLTDFLQNEINDFIVTEEELESLYESYNHIQDLPPLEDIRFQLEEEIKQEKFLAVFKDLIEDLKAKSNIQIFI